STRPCEPPSLCFSTNPRQMKQELVTDCEEPQRADLRWSAPERQARRRARRAGLDLRRVGSALQLVDAVTGAVVADELGVADVARYLDERTPRRRNVW